METTWTVVVWDEGDERVRPVGPTSSGFGAKQNLRGTLDDAKDRHAGARVVAWEDRSALVADVETGRER